MGNTLDDLKNELAFQRERPGSAAAGLEWAVAEIERLQTERLDAVVAERKRCADIVQRARFGEISQDFRSIVSRIKSGAAANEE